MGEETLAIKKLNRSRLKQSLTQIYWNRSGKVCDVVGTVIEAHIPGIQLGTTVEIAVGGEGLMAEVVGFRKDRVLLLPFNSMQGIAPGTAVTRRKVLNKVPVGDHLLGHVVDPFMNLLTHSENSEHENILHVPLERAAPNPIDRCRIEKPLSLGVRALDGLLTFGAGQRLGIMAGSGVGKSVMMGMIARGSSAEINVIGLIGERGREVREFIEKDLGEEGLKKSILVVVTSDQSPLMKVRGAKVVTAIAEHFASQGKDVLLMMDSLTRVAMAQREIGLAIGEPPTTKGYTPSVFSLLPKLLERSGPQKTGWGAISGLYTVLVDGDDFNDPIADATRSILDGHINLTRRLAAKGHYPAIDVSTSVSRVMFDIVGPEHFEIANKIKLLIGTYEENYDLVQIGAYQPGTNPTLDVALHLMPKIEAFLQQPMDELGNIDSSIAQLNSILSELNTQPDTNNQVEQGQAV